MAQATRNSASVLAQMDDAEAGQLHWKIMFTSGMGFFTDACYLFIIGTVMAILKDQWHPTTLGSPPPSDRDSLYKMKFGGTL
jgi:MFS transporter, PHS family, inorganic phosphate transporter